MNQLKEQLEEGEEKISQSHYRQVYSNCPYKAAFNMTKGTMLYGKSILKKGILDYNMNCFAFLSNDDCKEFIDINPKNIHETLGFSKSTYIFPWCYVYCRTFESPLHLLDQIHIASCQIVYTDGYIYYTKAFKRFIEYGVDELLDLPINKGLNLRLGRQSFNHFNGQLDYNVIKTLQYSKYFYNHGYFDYDREIDHLKHLITIDPELKLLIKKDHKAYEPFVSTKDPFGKSLIKILNREYLYMVQYDVHQFIDIKPFKHHSYYNWTFRPWLKALILKYKDYTIKPDDLVEIKPFVMNNSSTINRLTYIDYDLYDPLWSADVHKYIHSDIKLKYNLIGFILTCKFNVPLDLIKAILYLISSMKEPYTLFLK